MADTKGVNIEIRVKAQAQEARVVESRLRDLRQELGRLSDAFENHQRQSIFLRSQYRQLARAGDLTGSMADDLSKKIQRSQEAEQSAITATRKLIVELRDLGDESGYTAEELDDMARRLDEAEGYITGITPKTKSAAQSMRKLGDDVTHSVGRVEDGVKSLDGNMNRLTEGLVTMKGRITQGFVNSITDGIVDALYAAGRAIWEFVQDSNRAFSEFEAQTRQVFAQAPDLTADFRGAIERDALELAKEIGYLPQEIIPAMRKALNLGRGEDTILDDITLAATQARIAGTDLVETVVAGITPLNAYGGEIEDLARVYDVLNFVIQNSNLEQSDLNEGFNAIISPAAEARIGIEEVAGAMVTMSAQGDDATEIIDLLSNLFTQIQIDGTAIGSAFKEAAGVGFIEFKEAGGTLAEALAILDQHAIDTGQSLLAMVGGDSPFYRDMMAARAAVELTGRHMETLKEQSQAAANAQGSTAAAAAEFNDTMLLQEQRLAAVTEATKIMIGEAAGPGRRAWIEFKIAMLEAVTAQANTTASVNKTREALENQGFTAEQVSAMWPAIATRTNDFGAATVDAAAAEERLAIALDVVNRFGFTSTTMLQRQINAYELSKDAASRYSAELEDLNQMSQETIEIQRESNEAANEYAYFLEDLAQLGRGASNAQREAWEETQAQITATIPALENAKNVMSDFFSRAAFAGPSEPGQETDFNHWIYEVAAEAGIATADLYAMGTALGQFDEEAANNAINIAKIAGALELLQGKLANGEITWEQYVGAAQTAIEELQKTPAEKKIEVEMELKAFGERVDNPDAAFYRDKLGLGEEVERQPVSIELALVEDTIAAVEAGITGVTDSTYTATVDADGEPAFTVAGKVEDELNRIARTYTATIEITRTGGGYIPDEEAATGANFYVPPGYPNDSFLLGVTSGEHVAVTPVGSSGPPGTAGGSSPINITINQQFSGTTDTAAVAAATRYGLEQALAEAGL